jgi:hypothetical protein
MDEQQVDAQRPVTDALRMGLARMAVEAVKLHIDNVLATFPAELAQMNVDDDLLMAVKVLRRVTG